jgi:hypothetical protein
MSEAKKMDFALWLRLHGVGARGMSKMTPGELAQSAKISRSSAYFYINGDRVPDDPAVIARIAKVFHVKPADVPAFEPKPRKIGTEIATAA